MILSDPRRPRPLPAQFMAGLIARCDSDDLLLPPDSLEVGDTIRIIAGPFAPLITTVDSLTDDERLRVLIDLMGRKVKTIVDIKSVEKVSGLHEN